MLEKRQTVSLEESTGSVQEEMQELSYLSPQAKQTVGLNEAGMCGNNNIFYRISGRQKPSHAQGRLTSITSRQLHLFCFPFCDEFFHVGDGCRVGFGVLAKLDRLLAGGDGFGGLTLFGEHTCLEANVANRFLDLD